MSSLTILLFFFFFFNDTATTEIYTLSLHDALPISSGIRSTRRFACSPRQGQWRIGLGAPVCAAGWSWAARGSEEHTSELQSPCKLVCRLLLEKKKKQNDRKI